MTRLATLAIILAAAFAWAWSSTRQDLAAARGELHALRARLHGPRTLVRAVDGDTVVLDGKERVRIIGIDTPELFEKTKKGGWRKLKHPKPGAIEAHQYLRSLEGRLVRMQYGKRRTDRYGRSLAHLYLLPQGPDLATEILRSGWGKIMAIPPNTTRYAAWKLTQGR